MLKARKTLDERGAGLCVIKAGPGTDDPVSFAPVFSSEPASLLIF